MATLSDRVFRFLSLCARGSEGVDSMSAANNGQPGASGAGGAGAPFRLRPWGAVAEAAATSEAAEGGR